MSDEQNEPERLRSELEGSNATLRAITPTLLNGRGCWTHEEIVSTVNQWFHERKELERLQRQNAVMREALHHCLEASSKPEKYGRFLTRSDRNIIMAALQPSAGARYLSPEEVQPLVDAIRTIFHGHHDNAHDCMAASKVARQALDHVKQLGL